MMIWCFVLAFNGLAQQKNKMEYFNADIYKDWEIDTDCKTRENKKNLKKGSERITIDNYDNTIDVNRSFTKKPHLIKSYYYGKDKHLEHRSMTFYDINMHSHLEYDDKGAPFMYTSIEYWSYYSIIELVEKIKKEYSIDLEDKTQGATVRKSEDRISSKIFYEVRMQSKNNNAKINYVLLDGTTGDILFETICSNLQSDTVPPPYDQYLLALQEKERKSQQLKDNNRNIEFFSMEKYKSWKKDKSKSQSKSHKYLRKGNERLSISFYNHKIHVENTSVENLYRKVKVYNDSTKTILREENYLNDLSIGVDKIYYKNGGLILEKNNDEPYIFSLAQVSDKIKKECNVDIADLKLNIRTKRFVSFSDKKTYYKVEIGSKNNPRYMTDCFLIDGATGEILLETDFYYPKCRVNVKFPSPYSKYFYFLDEENKDKNNNSYYKTYKGKSYTKIEWEDFEEKWFNNNED